MKLPGKQVHVFSALHAMDARVGTPVAYQAAYQIRRGSSHPARTNNALESRGCADAREERRKLFRDP